MGQKHNRKTTCEIVYAYICKKKKKKLVSSVTVWLHGPIRAVAGGLRAMQPPWVGVVISVSCLFCFLEATGLAIGGRRGTATGCS